MHDLLPLSAWLVTYMVHSSVLLACAWTLSRLAPARHEAAVEVAWRVAMFGSIITTCIQVAVAARAPVMMTGGTASAILTRIVTGNPGPAIGSGRGVIFTSAIVCWLSIVAWRIAATAWSSVRLRRRLIDRRELKGEIRERAVTLTGGLRITVSATSRIATPIAYGRREVILPERALDEMSCEELDAVLAHEIAHLRRRDWFWLSLAAFVSRVFVMQPLNLVARARLRAHAERACDDWAVLHAADRLSLASALATVTEWMLVAEEPVLALGMASRESLTLQRVRRILDPSVARGTQVHHSAMALAAAAALLLVVRFAPGAVVNGSGQVRRAPDMPYTITAFDDAGSFTLVMDHGRAVGATMNGRPIDASRLEQTGNTVTVDGGALTVHVTPDGGIRWSARAR